MKSRAPYAPHCSLAVSWLLKSNTPPFVLYKRGQCQRQGIGELDLKSQQYLDLKIQEAKPLVSAVMQNHINNNILWDISTGTVFIYTAVR